MKYREVSKKLKSLGCEELPRRGAGSHRVWYNLKKREDCSIARLGRKGFETRHVARSHSTIGAGLARVFECKVSHENHYGRKRRGGDGEEIVPAWKFVSMRIMLHNFS